ncbi:nuclear transport factor 2 family protein [Chryseolinea soli]|uniref:Nuclear transport factor 2 family protein n=1 Tax=Chryseolinea soli TaxID=2321403 RepID=A0A385SJY4_9BACT|nr:nuclear transport factor 2 family protein [Chryseolinea soli]AYB30235.1 nuclear transport factor 2 family protein [Chryseolinea soli]
METMINALIESYVSALAQRSIETIDSLLHPEFKVIVNKSVPHQLSTFLSKTSYLDLIRSGKAGGDDYKIEDLSIHVMGPTAMAQYTLHGRQTIMHVFLQFIQEDEDWKIVSNMPYVTACAHA